LPIVNLLTHRHDGDYLIVVIDIVEDSEVSALV